MKARMLTFTLVFSVFGLFQTASAQDNFENVEALNLEPTTTEDPEEEEEKPFSISGFVDAYYQYHFQEQAFPTSFTETHNSFTPGMANVVFSKEGKFGFVADLAVGPRAEVANGYNGTTLALIKQLYVSYAPTEKLAVTMGNFGTHVGYEVIDAPANVNYSTSYMFSNGPFFHTGLKVDFAASENFGFMVGVFNDTDSKIDEVSGKHIGAQISFATGGLEAYLNYIGGKDDDSVSDNEIFGHQVDLTATYAVSDAFGLGLNTTVKTVSPDKGDATSWFGAALYANYALSEAFTLGLRGEYIGDDDGLISGLAGNSITSLTLSGNVHLGPITLIPEIRVDSAKEDSFLDEDGSFTGSSAAFIFAAVYAF
ncbi:porin [Saprospiraceae bacterium]|jgi:hypothetical protein|nr:porin [Bacteroidota bacterium]MDB4727176.1 porin [Saprospiraceae bacterium]